MSSPNFDERRGPIRFVVLHYTGMESGEAARERLCDADAKVSAHYLVWEDGRIEQLVADDKRAWHAGVGEWHGVRDVNSASIGIEIINGGHDFAVNGELPPFPAEQVASVTNLVRELLKRHELSPSAVIGHSDLAPARKQDPGEHFPWELLAGQDAAIWAHSPETDMRILFEEGERGREVSLAQRALAEIGYAIAVTGVMDAVTHSVITAFQRRFRPEKVDGVLDVQTMARISALVDRSV